MKLNRRKIVGGLAAMVAAVPALAKAAAMPFKPAAAPGYSATITQVGRPVLDDAQHVLCYSLDKDQLLAWWTAPYSFNMFRGDTFTLLELDRFFPGAPAELTFYAQRPEIIVGDVRFVLAGRLPPQNLTFREACAQQYITGGAPVERLAHRDGSCRMPVL